MKKKLTPNLTLFYTSNFPKKFNYNSTKKYSVTATPSGNYVLFNINPNKAILSKEGDCLYSYDEPVFEHIYSVRSASTVYISGNVNMLQVG